MSIVFEFCKFMIYAHGFLAVPVTIFFHPKYQLKTISMYLIRMLNGRDPHLVSLLLSRRDSGNVTVVANPTAYKRQRLACVFRLFPDFPRETFFSIMNGTEFCGPISTIN
jgi:tRNA nucleotidyltransferase (CCA-adding enzyme)